MRIVFLHLCFQVGTVTNNVGEAVRAAKQGLVDFRADKSGIVHAGLGKVRCPQTLDRNSDPFSLETDPDVTFSFWANHFPADAILVREGTHPNHREMNS